MFTLACWTIHQGCSHPRAKPNTITYKSMKRFHEQGFKALLADTHWDTTSIFDEVDDMVDTWGTLFNSVTDSFCLWRQKRVAREKQAPWMNKSIIEQLRTRDTLLKKAKLSNNTND